MVTKLAPYLPSDLLHEALATATTIDDPEGRAIALVGLAPHLPANERGPAIAQALESAAVSSRAVAAAAISAVLTEGLVTADSTGASVLSTLLRVQRWWP
jgi:hypothetical protein